MMDFNVIEQAIGVNERIYEGAAEQAVDADITLPDYCPDIQRILKCMVCPRINSVQVVGDRITADGSALVRILYVSDTGKICSYEQSYPFSKYVEVKGLDAGTCATVHPTVSYVNCRAVNQRRVDVHGMLRLAFQAVRKQDEKIITGADGDGVQLKRAARQTVSAVGDVERSFSLSEVIELDEEKPSIAQMIQTTATPVISDVKTISNKLLLKGELVLHVYYIPESEENDLVEVEHSIPISQIIEVEGIEEDSESEIALQVAATDVLPKSDSAGEQRLLDISARISAEVSANREVELPVLVDAYSTQHEMDLEQKNVDFLRKLEQFQDSFVAQGNLNALPEGVDRVFGMWSGEIQQTPAVADGALQISGTVMVHILYQDASGQAGYVERPIDFTYRRALQIPVERLHCKPMMQVRNSNWMMGADNRLDVKVELEISATVYSLDTDRIITGMAPDLQKEKSDTGAALTIYFTDPGEAVWDIARRYNTTVDAVQQENGLTAPTVENKRMLLIPGVR